MTSSWFEVFSAVYIKHIFFSTCKIQNPLLSIQNPLICDNHWHNFRHTFFFSLHVGEYNFFPYSLGKLWALWCWYCTFCQFTRYLCAPKMEIMDLLVLAPFDSICSVSASRMDFLLIHMISNTLPMQIKMWNSYLYR